MLVKDELQTTKIQCPFAGERRLPWIPKPSPKLFLARIRALTRKPAKRTWAAAAAANSPGTRASKR